MNKPPTPAEIEAIVREELEARGRSRFGLTAANIIAEVSRQRTARELQDPQTYADLQEKVEAELRLKWWAGQFDAILSDIHALCPVCREDGQVEASFLLEPEIAAGPLTYFHTYRVYPSDPNARAINWSVVCPASNLIVRRNHAIDLAEEECGPSVRGAAGIIPLLGRQPLIVPTPAQTDIPPASKYPGAIMGQITNNGKPYRITRTAKAASASAAPSGPGPFIWQPTFPRPEEPADK